MEVVINRCFGGFGLSKKAQKRYEELSGEAASWTIPRNCPHLVAVVKEMGEYANDKYSNLQIVEIPDDVDFEIEDYDGMEHVAEAHRTWY